MGRNSRLLLSALLTIAGAILPHAAEAGAVSTVTTLALSSPSAASPAAVTLTATVTAGGAPVANGTVTFCNAAATYCEDAAIVGKAQLNGGSARFKFIPAIGVHNYKAIFNATATAAASISSVQTLTVDWPLSDDHGDCRDREPERLSANGDGGRLRQPSAGHGRHRVVSGHERWQLRSGNSVPRNADLCPGLHPGARFARPHRQPTRSGRHRRLQRGWKTRRWQ